MADFDLGDSRLLRVLPEVYQVAAESSQPLQALLAVAEDMHAPVRDVLDRIHTVPDPGRSPSSLIPFLSRWVDLDWLTLPGPEATGTASAGIPVARQRDLIASAAGLSARRGTVDGLTRFLHLATGSPASRCCPNPAPSTSRCGCRPRPRGSLSWCGGSSRASSRRTSPTASR